MQSITISSARRILTGITAGIVLAIFTIAPAQAIDPRFAADTKFYGLFRGIVLANVDPLNMGRLKVQLINAPAAPDYIWALPVLHEPYTVKSLKVPQVGQGVWIEFEQGDVDLPAWLGTFPQAQR